MADPDWRQVIIGFAPTVEIVRNPEMLYLAMGILGATVMPHNLYLHSSIVQTRIVADTLPAKREAIKFATIDSTIALMLALLVNASILILAAATFHKAGHYEVADLGNAQQLLTPLLGSAWAATHVRRGAACAAASTRRSRRRSSGQIVMEGFINVRLPAWARRLATRWHRHHPGCHRALRSMAPAGTGKLLILSQVVLSMQLPFAIVPLVMFTADRRKMGELVSPLLGDGAGGHRRRRRDRAQHQGAIRSLDRLAVAIPPALARRRNVLRARRRADDRARRRCKPPASRTA